MTLPDIVLPKIVLPFDIPLLWHPAVIHFLIAIPIIVLLLELMNLMMKKKAVGGVSFFLLVLTVLFAATAYLTGLTDGKEAFDTLSEAAKGDLSEHKLLGTYLMLGSVLVLFLKLLAMTGNKILKGIYIFILIAFVVVMFKQGNEGGELVYEHGLNVKQVTTVGDILEDVNETLEETKSELDEALKSLNEIKAAEENAKCTITPNEPNEANTSAVPGETLPVFTPVKKEVVEEAKAETEGTKIVNEVAENNLTTLNPASVALEVAETTESNASNEANTSAE
ncbi:MAG: hypothetical protein GQ531_05525 [Sulfurovum sp.]|nr:hypothetical protein [Sulfurovum sp.]